MFNFVFDESHVSFDKLSATRRKTRAKSDDSERENESCRALARLHELVELRVWLREK